MASTQLGTLSSLPLLYNVDSGMYFNWWKNPSLEVKITYYVIMNFF